MLLPMPMTHDTAISTMATERYLLGEMSPEERSEFEEHYFDCFVCAADVKAAHECRDALALLASAAATGPTGEVDR